MAILPQALNSQPQGARASLSGLRPAIVFNAAAPSSRASLSGSVSAGPYGLARSYPGVSSAVTSATNASLSSGTADFIAIAVTNSLYGSYTPGDISLIRTNGDGYAGGFFLNSYYSTVEFSVKETYSGVTVSSGSVTKGKPAVVIGRRSGLNVDLFIKVQGAAATKVSTTDTVVRNVQANGSMSYGISGNNSVALAGLLEGGFSDTQIYALLDNPWQIFQPTNRQLFVAAAVGGTAVNPGVGSIAITGYAPTITQPQGITPSVGSITITGYAPTIAQGNSVNPGVGSITLTGYAPTIAQTANQAITAGAGSVAITGYAPSVVQSGGTAVNPGSGSIAITGYSPSVTQTANQVVVPGFGAFTISGWAPTVTRTTTTATIARTTSDASNTGWTPSTGVDLFAMVDEVIPDALDYISASTVGAVCKMGLNATVYPGTASQQLKYRASSSTGNSVIVRLKDGATTIRSTTQALTSTDTEYVITLTSGEIAAITSGVLQIELESA